MPEISLLSLCETHFQQSLEFGSQLDVDVGFGIFCVNASKSHDGDKVHIFQDDRETEPDHASAS